jgi:hypothetical protein
MNLPQVIPSQQGFFPVYHNKTPIAGSWYPSDLKAIRHFLQGQERALPCKIKICSSVHFRR